MADVEKVQRFEDWTKAELDEMANVAYPNFQNIVIMDRDTGELTNEFISFVNTEAPSNQSLQAIIQRGSNDGVGVTISEGMTEAEIYNKSAAMTFDSSPLDVSQDTVQQASVEPVAPVVEQPALQETEMPDAPVVLGKGDLRPMDIRFIAKVANTSDVLPRELVTGPIQWDSEKKLDPSRMLNLDDLSFTTEFVNAYEANRENFRPDDLAKMDELITRLGFKAETEGNTIGLNELFALDKVAIKFGAGIELVTKNGVITDDFSIFASGFTMSNASQAIIGSLGKARTSPEVLAASAAVDAVADTLDTADAIAAPAATQGLSVSVPEAAEQTADASSTLNNEPIELEEMSAEESARLSERIGGSAGDNEQAAELEKTEVDAADNAVETDGKEVSLADLEALEPVAEANELPPVEIMPGAAVETDEVIAANPLPATAVPTERAASRLGVEDIAAAPGFGLNTDDNLAAALANGDLDVQSTLNSNLEAFAVDESIATASVLGTRAAERVAEPVEVAETSTDIISNSTTDVPPSLGADEAEFAGALVKNMNFDEWVAARQVARILERNDTGLLESLVSLISPSDENEKDIIEFEGRIFNSDWSLTDNFVAAAESRDLMDGIKAVSDPRGNVGEDENKPKTTLREVLANVGRKPATDVTVNLEQLESLTFALPLSSQEKNITVVENGIMADGYLSLIPDGHHYRSGIVILNEEMENDTKESVLLAGGADEISEPAQETNDLPIALAAVGSDQAATVQSDDVTAAPVLSTSSEAAERQDTVIPTETVTGGFKAKDFASMASLLPLALEDPLAFNTTDAIQLVKASIHYKGDYILDANGKPTPEFMAYAETLADYDVQTEGGIDELLRPTIKSVIEALNNGAISLDGVARSEAAETSLAAAAPYDDASQEQEVNAANAPTLEEQIAALNTTSVTIPKGYNLGLIANPAGLEGGSLSEVINYFDEVARLNGVQVPEGMDIRNKEHPLNNIKAGDEFILPNQVNGKDYTYSQERHDNDVNFVSNKAAIEVRGDVSLSINEGDTLYEVVRDLAKANGVDNVSYNALSDKVDQVAESSGITDMTKIQIGHAVNIPSDIFGEEKNLAIPDTLQDNLELKR